MIRTAIVVLSALGLCVDTIAAQTTLVDENTSQFCFDVTPADDRFDWLPERVLLTVHRRAGSRNMQLSPNPGTSEVPVFAPGFARWSATINPGTDHLIVRTSGDVGNSERLIGGLYIDGFGLIGTVPFTMIADGEPADSEAFRLARTVCP